MSLPVQLLAVPAARYFGQRLGEQKHVTEAGQSHVRASRIRHTDIRTRPHGAHLIETGGVEIKCDIWPLSNAG
jgi:hypothetical protein